MLPRQLCLAELRFRKIGAPHLAVEFYRGAKLEDREKLCTSVRRATA
jgi:hypothetical protein